MLTKPDTIQEGEEQQWLDIMEGRRHPLKHRYFVTRHPNQKELNRGITIRRCEAERNGLFRDQHLEKSRSVYEKPDGHHSVDCSIESTAY